MTLLLNDDERNNGAHFSVSFKNITHSNELKEEQNICCEKRKIHSEIAKIIMH